MFPPSFLNIIHLESTFVKADARCDDNSIWQMTTFIANKLIFKTDNMVSFANQPGIVYTSEASGFIHSLLRRTWRYQMVIIIRKSKQDKQHNGQKKKDAGVSCINNQ
jgi:hypothetical protein